MDSKEGTLDAAHLEIEEKNTATFDKADLPSFAAQNDPAYKAEEKRILRKMDLRLIPMLALLYLLSFLDRGSIGNAKIQGLPADLNLVGDQYNWCLTVFFFPYAFLEPLSNAFLVKFRPSIWLPSIMVGWGIAMTLTGIVHNYSGLIAARFFLGVAEAGLFPGITFYITLWYTRRDAQLRIAMVFASASLAGAFSGLLAFLIVKMDGVGNLAGWRWIFILEGIATVVVAVGAFFVIFDSPSTASFLTAAEKKFVIDRLHIDQPYAHSTGESDTKEKFKWKYAWMAFIDWQTWLHCLGYWGLATPLYSLSLFLPTIINAMGYTASSAQLLTIPIYAAAAISTVVVAYFADRVQRRGIFVLSCFLATMVGFIMAVAPTDFIPGLTYAGCFIAACGLYPGLPGLLAWSSNNYAPNPKRAIGMAIQIGFGTMGGAAAANFYHAADAPRYRVGHSLALTFTALGFLCMLVYYLLISGINKKRSLISLESYSEDDLVELGDKAPNYKYTL